MKHLVIFDLDGVLVDSKDLHYQALNLALESIDQKYVISPKEHLTTYDGLSTRKKLELLQRQKNLPSDSFQLIWEKKQDITSKLIGNIREDSQLVAYLNWLKENNFSLALASNSIKNTVNFIISQLGLDNLFDLILSNEDIKNIKPHPEIFWKCMTHFGVLPTHTVIFEDSHIGRQAAISSGAFLIPVENRSDLTWEKIRKAEMMLNSTTNINHPWKSDKLNVLIPMAGAGSRFESAGYTFPKPLVEVKGQPMIQVVVNNLNIEANYIFIVQKQHFEKYNLGYMLNLIAPNCKIIQINEMTEGAACTTLLASEYIDNDNPLLIANSDQFLEWNSSETLYTFSASGLDGGIVTFESTHPKWSYVSLDTNGFIREVAEKRPISNIATVGLYYWKQGKDYVRFARQMINKNIRTNNEFYVAPVFNEAIQGGLKFKIKDIEKMWGLGTPEDLDSFLKNFSVQ